VPLPLTRIVVALFLCVVYSASSFAQSPAPAPALVARDEVPLTKLNGTVHPLARPENDRGSVADSFPASRMLVLLNPPADRQQALQHFLRDAHNPGSLSYHQWLTPEQFGAQFGASDEDLQQVQTWLQSHGFSINRVTKSRRALEFSGTAAQVREALHTPIHQYQVAGKTYYSIANEVSIPQSIAPLLKGFAPLNNFPLKSFVHTVGKATYSPATGHAKPQFTTTNPAGAPFYAIAPEDFATQYDVTPLYQAGTNGAGQTIGIIGEYNLDLTLTGAYRTLFGLSSDNTQVVIDGEDPGDSLSPLELILTTSTEGYLDVEVSGAVAPKATVNYYIATGTQFQNLISLAAMRAIEDNQASVLAVTFGQCEQLLGPDGNQLWSSLWEQAAAQGQTVLVASGYEGPTSCGELASANGQITYLGLSVNGVASTPWDVAVGGTDFYYSDYATGGISATNDWNATNDGKFGSLKAPLQEQPWDEELGLNIPPNFAGMGIGVAELPNLAGLATGGGPSSCSQFIVGPPYPYVCTGGYAKPAWQNAPGVPADGVRDIPDISLLAAGGSNLSAYAICMEANDCSPINGAEPQITLAGGTSAATAAMAGTMALVNQKYGRQGQANFVLYALAQQQPSVFHDVTVGTNDTFCLQPVCPVMPPPNQGIPSWGVYAAGPGYDLASGLGSFDVNALVSNWSKITFQPTSTTLTLSPASVVHGATVSVTATVKPASGTAIPTGAVAIETTAPTPTQQNSALTLASGTATANWSFFPGGTYQVTAQYGGDGSFAPSTSASSALTVTRESSNTSLLLQYEALGAPLHVFIGTVPNGGSAPFGSAWFFTAQPTGQTSQSTGDASGTATFTDGATSVTLPLNAQGLAIWSPQTLALGSHSVSVSYSGDASYNPSTGGPLAFTVTQGTPLVICNLLATTASISIGPPLTFTYQAGTTAVVRVLLQGYNFFVPPTGNVTVNFGPLTQTVAVTPALFANRTEAEVSVAFPNVAAGTYALTASYAGDSDWNAATSGSAASYTFANSTAAATTTALSLTPSSVDSSRAVTFTTTVTSTQAQLSGPSGQVALFANGYLFGLVNVQAASFNAGSTTATGTATLQASQIPSGALQVTGTYLGSTTYMPSTSAAVPLTVTLSDFTLSLGAPNATVASGQSASVPLLLGGPNGGSATLTLNCLPSAASFGCSVSPSSPTVKGATTASVTINAYSTAIVASASPDRAPAGRALLAASASFAFALALLVALPNRRTRRGLQLCCALLCVGTLIAGCGGGSSVINPPPPPQKINTPPGTYSVVVTAASGAITHNVKFNVVVQ
jgi:Pro-kumamolisin, activation domain/Bacterial Ig-like domain (group 3)